MNPQLNLMLQQAMLAFQGGNLESANTILRRVIQVDTRNLPALHILGLISASQENYRDAVVFLARAAKINSNDASIQYNLAKAHLDSGSNKESIPHHKKAVELAPDNFEAWLNYGKALSNLGLHEEALGHYDKALSLKSDYIMAILSKCVTLKELKRHDDAMALAELALTINPNSLDAWVNHGLILHGKKRYEEAITSYDRVLSLKPDYVQIWNNKGVILQELKRYEDAIESYDQALKIKPNYVEVWMNKGDLFNLVKLHIEAAKCYQKALELRPEASYLLGKAHHQMMLGCEWAKYEEITNEIFNQINRGEKVVEVFGFQGIAESENLLQKCAITFSNDKFPALGNLAGLSRYGHTKIRIGYLCGEFRNQATSVLMTRIWELHNKAKFEIYAFDNGWNDRSEYRQRIESAFDVILDISQMSDIETANLIHSNEIDILVNLNGFFGLSRHGVFSYKPAPIQVNYLGFPGTLGSPYIDYIIGDPFVIPEKSREFFTEKIAYLPNSYQANDNIRKISNRQFSRRELGIPENGFVFACFNNNFKIAPATFDLWARILKMVEGSVLWLLADNQLAKNNLIKEVVARGISPERLVFADRMESSEHLARHRLAGLFLDTLPCNAHTTCSDALWSGLPVLTLVGSAFPGRVSAGLLNAIGMPELIATTEEDYVALAVELATSSVKLTAIKERLASNISSKPLFDSCQFTEHLESAYLAMIERHQAGLQPDHIFVT